MPGFKKLDPTESKKDMVKIDNIGENAKSLIDRILGDISKSSATKQLLLGTSSGWVTGYLAMKVGKAAACAVGGGIILLEIANEKGYIRINWDKVNRQIDKVSDRVEQNITGESSSWMDKMERYVDKTADKAERTIKGSQKKAKQWYSSFIGESDGKLKKIHIFLLSFAAGVAIGIGTS